MTPRQIWQIFMLALCMWREGQNQTSDALIALGCSIRNRTLVSRWWNQNTPGDYVAVILMPEQYSSFNPDDPNAKKIPGRTDPVFTQCLQIAASIANGSQLDTVQGCESYIDKSMDGHWPQWANEMTHVLDVGDFHFFKA